MKIFGNFSLLQFNIALIIFGLIFSAVFSTVRSGVSNSISGVDKARAAAAKKEARKKK